MNNKNKNLRLKKINKCFSDFFFEKTDEASRFLFFIYQKTDEATFFFISLKTNEAPFLCSF